MEAVEPVNEDESVADEAFLLVDLGGILRARDPNKQEEWDEFYRKAVEDNVLRSYQRLIALKTRIERWKNLEEREGLQEAIDLFWDPVKMFWPTCDDRAFNSMFGASLQVFERLWQRYGPELVDKMVFPVDILMVFHYLTTGDTFDVISVCWRTKRSTSHYVISKTICILYGLLDEISWNRLPWHKQEILPGPEHMLHQVTFILDGIECRIAKPVDRVEEHAWLSPKHNMHAIKYEVAVSLSSGRIMWFAGGIPAAYHDSTLTRSSGILQRIPNGEKGIADAGYTGVDGRIMTILRTTSEGGVVGFTSEEMEYNRALAALRIEVERVNGRLKRFQALVFSRIRERYDHALIFHVLANFVNIWMEVEPMRAEEHPILGDCPFPVPERARR